MRGSHLRVSVDHTADAAYVSILDTAIDRTEQFSENILVDLDNMNMVVGIEFLRLDATVDLDVLAKQYHLSSDVESTIRSGMSSRSSFSADASSAYWAAPVGNPTLSCA